MVVEFEDYMIPLIDDTVIGPVLPNYSFKGYFGSVEITFEYKKPDDAKKARARLIRLVNSKVKDVNRIEK